MRAPGMLYPLFILAALAYGAAIFAYGTYSTAQASPSSSGTGAQPRRSGDLALAIAGVLHTACIGAQCVEGDHPFASVFLVVSFGALIAVWGYFALAFIVSRRRSIPALGAILAPVGFIGLGLGVMFGAPVLDRLPADTVLAKSHIALATAGVALLTLATGVAALYLTMARRLRHKTYRPGPGGVSLASLDRMHHRLILLVMPVLTLALVTGVLWILRLGGPEMLGPRWIELMAGGVAWLASVSLLITRAAFGMRGRKAAGLTLLAFLGVVVILLFYGVRP